MCLQGTYKTLLENLKLCPKVQFSEKSQNCEFDFLCQKMNEFIVIMTHLFLLEFEIARQKWSKFNIFDYCRLCTYIKSRFMTRKFKLSMYT